MLALWLVQGTPGIIARAIAAGVSVAAHLIGAYGSNPYGSPLGWVYVLTWQLYMVYIASPYSLPYSQSHSLRDDQ